MTPEDLAEAGDRHLNKLLADAYNLAMLIFMQAHGFDPPGTESHKPWDLLRSVADGTQTVFSSPAEMALKAPHLAEDLAKKAPIIMQQHRDLAKRILSGLQSRF